MQLYCDNCSYTNSFFQYNIVTLSYYNNKMFSDIFTEIINKKLSLYFVIIMFEKRIGIGRKPSVRLTNQSVPDKIYCAGEAVYFTRKEQTD